MIMIPDLAPGVAVALARPPEADPGVLSAAEAERLHGFAHPERRRSFVLGRTVARRLVAQAEGGEPREARLRVGVDGAPRVDGSPRYLSISHAGRGRALVAGAALAPRRVGLDLELIQPRRPDLWTRILRPDEHALLDAVGGATDEGQTLLWSLKEAVLKARRTGFRAGARSVRLHEIGTATAATALATDSDGGRWALAYRRWHDVWVCVALHDAGSREIGPDSA